jgi:arginine deiminase
VDEISSSDYAFHPHAIAGGIPMYQFSQQDAALLDKTTPFVNIDRVGMGPQMVPQYDMNAFLKANRRNLIPSKRHDDNMTNAQRAYGYRTNPNTVVNGQISSREQVQRDYRSPYIALQFGGSASRPVASRQPTSSINIQPISR